MRTEEDPIVLSVALTRTDELNQKYIQARNAAEKFRVACYPRIPGPDDPMMAVFEALAAKEGKLLELIQYPLDIPKEVFERAFVVYDEIADLDWRKWYPRRVVRWRGKKMVFFKSFNKPKGANV